MKPQALTQKIEKAVQSYRREKLSQLKKYRSRGEHAKRYRERLKLEMVRGTPFELVFKKRRMVFENYKGSCALDLINETGHTSDDMRDNDANQFHSLRVLKGGVS